MLDLCSGLRCSSRLGIRLAARNSPPGKRPDSQPFPPYRIIANIYYVDASDIISYLITTPAGHFLINSGYEDTPPLIRDGIVTLGSKPANVKILLNNQAHYDHVAGQSAMQRISGARSF